VEPRPITPAGAALAGAARGAALGLAPFLLAGARLLAPVSGEEGRIAAVIAGALGREIARTELRLLAVTIAAGAALGAVAGLAAAALRPRGRRAGRIALEVAIVLAGYGLLLARAVVRAPGLYDAALYAPGGITAAAMAFITHRVPARALDAALALPLAGLLAHAARRRPRVGVPASLATAAGLALAFARAAPPLATPRAEGPPNVLILAVESLRPDHTSLMGYGRETTPHLEALGREAAVFEQAYVPIARTLPSWGVILSGTYPHTSGLRHMFPRAPSRTLRVPTLPRLFAARGYRTAVVSDYAGEMFNLVDFGFERVIAPPCFSLDVLMERRLLAEHGYLLPFLENGAGRRLFPALGFLLENSDPFRLADEALRAIRAADGAPFFVTVFFSTTHLPYAAPDPYYRIFTDAGYRGPHRYGHAVREASQLGETNRRPPEADVAQIVGLYDGAVRAVDDAIGEVLAALERTGLASRTIVVVLADHGENLYEEDAGIGHGQHFRADDAANRIPLMVRAPGGRFAPGRRRALVRSLDLAPTLCDSRRDRAAADLRGDEPPAAPRGRGRGPGARALRRDRDLGRGLARGRPGRRAVSRAHPPPPRRGRAGERDRPRRALGGRRRRGEDAHAARAALEARLRAARARRALRALRPRPRSLVPARSRGRGAGGARGGAGAARGVDARGPRHGLRSRRAPPASIRALSASRGRLPAA
jgi:hypothetical protein